MSENQFFCVHFTTAKVKMNRIDIVGRHSALKHHERCSDISIFVRQFKAFYDEASSNIISVSDSCVVGRKYSKIQMTMNR